MSISTLIKFAQLSLGIIFLWYGMLKFFPSFSPAEELAISTINILSFHLIPSYISIKLLAIWEVIVGIGFILNRYTKVIVVLFLIHMSLTFSPLILLPEISFTHAPYAFSLVGQYIVKNVVLILVGLMIYQKESYDTKRLPKSN